jgi:hypothetical protein
MQKEMSMFMTLVPHSMLVNLQHTEHGSWENQSDQLTNTCSEYILPYALYQTNPYCHKGSGSATNTRNIS